jgi:hypothetical protein
VRERRSNGVGLLILLSKGEIVCLCVVVDLVLSLIRIGSTCVGVAVVNVRE